MTLNVTVLTLERIYQSGDFRLTDPVTGDPVRNNSLKVVTIQNREFTGIVTYTGVGEWPSGRDTSAVLVDWLAEIGDIPLDEVAAGLATRASTWIREISRSTGKRRRKHTFVLAAFSGGLASVRVISNYEDTMARNDPEAGPGFFVSSREAGARPIVIVTGMKNAVERHERRSIERLVRKHPGQHERIRNAIMQLNATAASSPKAREGISPECTVVSLGRDGRGMQQLTPGSLVETRGIAFGNCLPELSDLVGTAGATANARLVSAAFVSGGPDIPEALPAQPCTLSKVASSDQVHELTELSESSLVGSQARAINGAMTVAGYGTPHNRPTETELWIWQPDTGVIKLPMAVTGGGEFGVVLNDSGTLAAGERDSDGYLRAVVWDGHQVNRLDKSHARDSGVRALNEGGTVAGWIWLDPADRTRLHQRPSIWRPGEETEVLANIPGQWGQAIGINSEGTSLIGVHREAWFDNFPMLWMNDGRLRPIAESRRVIPVGITDDRQVFGFVNTSSGYPESLVSVDGGDWQSLGIASGWRIDAVSRNGWVAGSFVDDGFERPWVRSPSEEVTELSYFRYHHCRVSSVSSIGDVAGYASTDHGSHAILWTRRVR
jgi:hypothetical protein